MLKNVTDVFPLTGMQQMMLVRTLRDPQSSLFVERLSATIEGRLDLAIMRQAWQRAAQLHPALRTAIVWQGLDRPLQVVRERVDLPLVEHDVRALSATEQERRLAERSAAAARPFDLGSAPLVRLDVFRLADDRYRFFCHAHHLLFDGWSLAILLGEILDLYRRLATGQPVALRPPRGFRDYVAWLQKQEERAAQDFWQNKLAGFRSPTPIGFRRATNSAEAERGQISLAARLAPPDAAQLKDWLRQRQLTLSTLLHGAWAITLARHSGQREVLFGTTVSGRPADLPGVEVMVGPFINNVPLRVRFAGQKVLDWLKQVQSGLGELTGFQHTPLVDIERWSDLDGHARLFESLVVLENYPRAIAALESLPDLRLSDFRGTATTTYPLSLVARPEEASFDLCYDAGRFSPDEAEALLREFEHLVVQLPQREDEL
ncbi:MAG TPA: condensation domain-containing protein, partial [Pirellulales bacterium]|nr:condensation domain-containing protein [Pirellulales bacterium]